MQRIATRSDARAVDGARRATLGMIVASIGALVVGCSGERDPNTTTTPALTAVDGCLMTLPAAARAIGEGWLKDHPDASVESLSTAVYGAAQPPQSADLDALRAKIQADYAAGRMVQLSRWYLAETEARLCALAVRINCLGAT